MHRLPSPPPPPPHCPSQAISLPRQEGGRAKGPLQPAQGYSLQRGFVLARADDAAKDTSHHITACTHIDILYTGTLMSSPALIVVAKSERHASVFRYVTIWHCVSVSLCLCVSVDSQLQSFSPCWSLYDDKAVEGENRVPWGPWTYTSYTPHLQPQGNHSTRSITRSTSGDAPTFCG